MTQAITLLDHTKHGQLKIGAQDLSHLQDQHIVPVTLHEFPRVAVEFPIVFVKNTETGEFQAVAMLGLKPGQNLYVNDGRWTGLYQPHVVRDYPLGLVLNPEVKDKVWIGIRDSSPSVNDNEGEALFNGDQETEFLATRKQALIEHFQQDQVTKTLLNKLAELELLESQTLNVDIKGEKRNINGLYLISEPKLSALSEEQFSELRRLGLIGPIYSHLTSLNQIQRLARTEANS
ncbi:SapC family protein [Shewanella sp. NIFS-20-20]|uniref:SapC family protein n=1 Tax=Shewanella sp. NIFS-20-20 TaxID=2853806 RepID=UPI001C447C53|nr:SapC family protein [Shewanella sp. NIFS-20-20]MBV7315433.1 SapC family protein [Shewanella sp. NIFS-20-20]